MLRRVFLQITAEAGIQSYVTVQSGQSSEGRGFQKLGVQDVQKQKWLTKVHREQPFPNCPRGSQRFLSTHAPRASDVGGHLLSITSTRTALILSTLFIGVYIQFYEQKESTRSNSKRNPRGLGVPIPTAPGTGGSPATALGSVHSWKGTTYAFHCDATTFKQHYQHKIIWGNQLWIS